MVNFDRLTDAHLLAADLVAAVDAVRPAAELPILRSGNDPSRTARVLLVVVGPAGRDEQVREIRRRLVELKTSGAAPV